MHVGPYLIFARFVVWVSHFVKKSSRPGDILESILLGKVKVICGVPELANLVIRLVLTRLIVA